MNEITRRAANALVATVDFFSGALAAESQAGEEKQKQLDALAAQLKEQIKADEKAFLVMEDQIDALRKERDDLLQKCKNLRAEKPVLSVEETRKILAVLHRVEQVISLKPRTKAFGNAMVCLARAMKDIDGIKLEP